MEPRWRRDERGSNLRIQSTFFTSFQALPAGLSSRRRFFTVNVEPKTVGGWNSNWPPQRRREVHDVQESQVRAARVPAAVLDLF